MPKDKPIVEGYTGPFGKAKTRPRRAGPNIVPSEKKSKFVRPTPSKEEMEGNLKYWGSVGKTDPLKKKKAVNGIVKREVNPLLE